MTLLKEGHNREETEDLDVKPLSHLEKKMYEEIVQTILRRNGKYIV